MMKVRNPVVIHWVRHMDLALAFYKQLFAVSSLTESPTWSVLDLDAVKLALHIVDEESPERPLANAGLNLEVDDLGDVLHAAQSYGGSVVGIREPGPTMPFRVAIIEDTEGNRFELRERA